MKIQISLPARINILGNPGDANEGDFATISAAVELRAGAIIQPADVLCFGLVPPPDSGLNTALIQEGHEVKAPLPYTGTLDLMKAAFNRLYQFSPDFRQELNAGGVKISIWSEVPRQSGLGGSSLLVLLVLAGLREFYSLDRRKYNDYVLAELAQRVEARELGITCGYADRYVPLFGGIAYIDYRGKLDQLEIHHEPYATYEKLDKWVDQLPFVAISSGIQRDSGDIHAQMRPRYLREHKRWLENGGSMPELVRLMNSAWQTAWQGKISLIAGEMAHFGELMNENHRLVNKMMKLCGLAEGAGRVNNMLIEAALEGGALGAKLTGAGYGGSVFALTRPGEEDQIEWIWKRVAARNNLPNAYVFRPTIAKEGLIVEHSGS